MRRFIFISFAFSIIVSSSLGIVTQEGLNNHLAFAAANEGIQAVLGLGVIQPEIISPDQNHYIFLPIVIKDNAGVFEFPNGNFELGPVIWVQYSTNGYQLIFEEFLGGITPYDGSWAAWLGSDDPYSYIQQYVSVPTDYHYLSYWNWIDSVDACGYDIAWLSVNGNSVEEFWLCSENNTYGWVESIVDLGDYAGQSVVVQFGATLDSSVYSDWYIDHVSFKASP